jgi:predicted 2-oxoglutarate/Fe(II)-dependent dioxygenase YbiX
MSTITTDLADALGTIDRSGDFFVSGTAEMFAPRLEIVGVGQLALPLLPSQAEQLIAVAERAPYGRGEATLTDTSVRRTWQINPSRVTIGGRYWAATLEAILTRAAEGLGVTEPVEAEFYKLLIYDEGSFFVRHRDTEKVSGMFATLILVLPSVSAGGELLVRHKDREVRLGLCSEDPAELAFAAFYADCVHEVLPITSGYRLALIYNLVRRGAGLLPVPPDHCSELDAVTALLQNWADDKHSADDDSPEKLIYPLEHAYTPAELGFGALKGADAAVAKVVAEAAHRAACDLHLALVSVQESGSAEHTGYSRSWRSRSHDNNEFEAGEIHSRTVMASDWCRPDGEPSPLTRIPVDDLEFSPPEAFEGLEPDEEYFREATGNEGASFERTYRRAALVLWPQDKLLAVINQAGLRVTLPYLTDLAERWEASGEGQASTLWNRAHDLSAQMVATWPTEYWRPRRDNEPTSIGQMMTLLARFKDVANLELFLATIGDRGGFDLGDTAAIVDAVHLLAPERAASAATRLVTASVELTLAACGRLLALAGHLDQAVVLGAATALVAALPDGSPGDAWRRGPGVGPDFVVDLFTALARIHAPLADRAASHMLACPSTYAFDTILVPAVRDLLGSNDVARMAAVQRLRVACVAHLDARVAEPLEAPRDWQRASTLGCKCPHCAELSRFLEDPQTSRWVFRANEGDRSHVESTILTARCDVDAVTERRGRPYSLICTKNQASYERLRTQRQHDLADLERLGG